jgi:hypothetical protein
VRLVFVGQGGVAALRHAWVPLDGFDHHPWWLFDRGDWVAICPVRLWALLVLKSPQALALEA